MNDPNAFFNAVLLFDSYYLKCEEPRDSRSMRLVMVTALMMVSKILEVEFLELKFCVEHLLSNKYSAKEVLDCETEILEITQWSIIQMTTYDSLALLASRLLNAMAGEEEKTKFSELMSDFLIDELLNASKRDLALILVMPRYLTTDRLNLVAGLLSFKIKEFEKKVDSEGSSVISQEYEKLT